MVASVPAAADVPPLPVLPLLLLLLLMLYDTRYRRIYRSICWR